MTKYNGNKFSFQETFNNADGKTSGSGFIGIIGSLFCMSIVIIGLIVYIISLYTTPPNASLVLPIINTTVVTVLGLASLYAALLGLRKWKNVNIEGKEIPEGEVEETGEIIEQPKVEEIVEKPKPEINNIPPKATEAPKKDPKDIG